MKQCKQCQNDVEQTPGKVEKVFCSDKCRKAYGRAQPRTESTPDNPGQPTPDKDTLNHSVEQCKRRAAAGKPWRPGDPVWPYTRHLTPVAFVAWCRLNKPSWLTHANPGDEDYNWDESAVPASHPARIDAAEALA